MACLEDLPNEILWHIISFLKPGFIVNVLSEVSPRFRALVEDQTLWRRRLCSRWPGQYATSPPDWVECCKQREEHYEAFHRWQDGGVRHLQIKDAHIATVDAIKFIENGSRCVTGSRDHNLKIWKIDSEDLEMSSVFWKAHTAWIWSIEQLDSNTLVSGSFDQTVKTWDLEKQNRVDTVKYSAAVLSLAEKDKLIACSTMDSRVHLKDFRTKHNTKSFAYHKNIVLTLAMDDKVIVSGSKDGSVAIFDIRAEKVASKVANFKGYPMAISYGDNQVWMGTSRGYLACLDMQKGNEAQFAFQKRISYKQIRSVHHSWGSVVVAAGDDQLIILEPTRRMGSIKKQHVPEGLTKACMHNRTICGAGNSGELILWLPEPQP